MSSLEKIDIKDWDKSILQELQNQAVQGLEEGKILYFPALFFPNRPSRKAISFSGKIRF